MTRFTENHVEEAVLEWLGELEWTVAYPPDLQDAAVQTVIQQAELLAAAW